MLTYHDMEKNGTIDRFNVFLQRKGIPLFPREGKNKVRQPTGREHYTRTMFMDSGAYTLYNVHVRKKNGSHAFVSGGGRLCRRCEQPRKHPNHFNPPPKHVRGVGDVSYYSLKKGSEFRCYCNNYAYFVKAYEPSGMLFTNVDVITRPELTWEVQQYFEKEHGLTPVPVVHANTDLSWMWKYVDAGKYKLLGLGGLGQNINIHEYHNWATQVYKELCPASNDFLPLIRTHGFAMTSWKLIREYPWWSVDSATWIKLAAYGWLYVPGWSREKECWDYDIPPFQINVSVKSPQDAKGRHYSSLSKEKKKMVNKWLARCELDLGSVEMTAVEDKALFGMGLGRKEFVEEDFEEDSVSGHFVYRAASNLHYLKDLEESRPKWPYPFKAPAHTSRPQFFDSRYNIVR